MVVKIDIKTEPVDIGNIVHKILSGLTGKVIEKGLQDISERVRNIIQGKSPVGIGETSGNFKQAWSGLKKVSGGFAWSNPKSYGGLLEEGLYRSVGERTISTNVGIYSKQAVGGILQPLIDDNSFIEFIVGAVADRMLKQLERNSAGI